MALDQSHLKFRLLRDVKTKRYRIGACCLSICYSAFPLFLLFFRGWVFWVFRFWLLLVLFFCFLFCFVFYLKKAESCEIIGFSVP